MDLRKKLSKNVIKICEVIANNGGESLLVGGAVRDLLLKRKIKDSDLEVRNLNYHQLKKCLSKLGTINEVGKSFKVLKIKLNNEEIDIALPRKEVKKGQGHKGFEIIADPTLDYKAAAKRRDFTINSIGYDPLKDKIYDPYGGIKDLENKILKHISSAFSEDPLRVYRAMQFAARFNFKISLETIRQCQECNLEELPKERIFEEIKKLCLQAKKPSIGYNYWQELGILKYFPELEALKYCPQDPEWHPEGDVWDHTMMVVDEAATQNYKDDNQKLIIALAALCHDFGKPLTTAKINGRWRSPGHEQAGVKPSISFLRRFWDEKKQIDAIANLVDCHLRPALLYNAQEKDKVSNAAIRRLSLKVPIENLLLLARADHFGRKTPDALAREFPAGDWLKKRADQLDVIHAQPKALILGRDLIALGYKPGPALGKILNRLFQAQLDDKFKSKEEGLNWLNKSEK